MQERENVQMKEYVHGIIDLHVHSTASDGSMSPSGLVRYAKASGLEVIALTDHDTVEGVEEALREGRSIGLEVLPGIEIGVDFKREMHILGYFDSNDYMNISSRLSFFQENREKRNYKVINRLREMGFAITMDEVRKKAEGGIVGRPHIAKVLQEKGYVLSVADAFDRYLAYGKPAYFKKDKLTPREGIEEIARAGGVAVLAHPILLNFQLQELDKLLEELASYGLKGIEAYYTDNTGYFTRKTIEFAEKHKLLVTGGTDFHGTFKPDIKIGKGYGNLTVPYKLLQELKKAISEAKKEALKETKEANV